MGLLHWIPLLPSFLSFDKNLLVSSLLVPEYHFIISCGFQFSDSLYKWDCMTSLPVSGLFHFTKRFPADRASPSFWRPNSIRVCICYIFFTEKLLDTYFDYSIGKTALKYVSKSERTRTKFVKNKMNLPNFNIHCSHSNRDCGGIYWRTDSIQKSAHKNKDAYYFLNKDGRKFNGGKITSYYTISEQSEQLGVHGE